MLNKLNNTKMKNLKEYKVYIYESKESGSYLFNTSDDFCESRLTNVLDAIMYAKKSVISQRNYRATSGKLYATIKGNDISDHGLFLSEEELTNNIF